MESNSWISCTSVFSSSSSSRRYQSRSDLYLEEDVKGEDNLKAEFICPFCADEFDIVGLCCHIDEQHPVEAKNGPRRRLCRGGGYSSAYLKKELGETNLQSLGGSSTFIPSSNIDSDPLLSSFMFNPPPLVNEFARPITEGDSVVKVSPKDTLKSNIRQVLVSNEDQEKAR